MKFFSQQPIRRRIRRRARYNPSNCDLTVQNGLKTPNQKTEQAVSHRTSYFQTISCWKTANLTLEIDSSPNFEPEKVSIVRFEEIEGISTVQRAIECLVDTVETGREHRNQGQVSIGIFRQRHRGNNNTYPDSKLCEESISSVRLAVFQQEMV